MGKCRFLIYFLLKVTAVKLRVIITLYCLIVTGSFHVRRGEAPWKYTSNQVGAALIKGIMLQVGEDILEKLRGMPTRKFIPSVHSDL
jgi:hypothetical protein